MDAADENEDPSLTPAQAAAAWVLFGCGRRGWELSKQEAFLYDQHSNQQVPMYYYSRSFTDDECKRLGSLHDALPPLGVYVYGQGQCDNASGLTPWLIGRDAFDEYVRPLLNPFNGGDLLEGVPRPADLPKSWREHTRPPADPVEQATTLAAQELWKTLATPPRWKMWTQSIDSWNGYELRQRARLPHAEGIDGRQLKENLQAIFAAAGVNDADIKVIEFQYGRALDITISVPAASFEQHLKSGIDDGTLLAQCAGRVVTLNQRGG